MDLFSRKSQVVDFSERTKGMSNEEVRKMEVQLLQPEKLSPPICPDPCPDTVLTRYVKVYFPTPEALEEFEKRVTVRHIGERTTTDTQKILDALRAAYPMADNDDQTIDSAPCDTVDATNTVDPSNYTENAETPVEPITINGFAD